jgi:serine/threonine protein phosphatase PrpC
VTYVPEVNSVDLLPEDKFLIVGCDGLWDVVSNEQAVQIVNKYVKPVDAATALRDYAHHLGSTDNISVIVYRFDDEVKMDELSISTRNTYKNPTPSTSRK